MTKELIDRVRTFEIDHKPDGWPAIRMRDISALADALEEAERKLEIAIVVMENLVAVKGRYHTEQAYNRIVEALKVLKQTKGSE